MANEHIMKWHERAKKVLASVSKVFAYKKFQNSGKLNKEALVMQFHFGNLLEWKPISF